MFATDDTPAQQATPFEHFYVFRDRRRRHREAARKFSDCLFSSCEPFDDTPARRVAERREGVVDFPIVNHLVNYSRRETGRQASFELRRLFRITK
jgi:hypothetical protein